MASQEELENIRKMREELEEVLILQRSFTTEALATAKAVFGIGEQSKAISKAFRDISNISADIGKDLQQILKGEKGLSDLLKTQEKQKRNLAALDVELLTTLRATYDITDEQADIFGRLTTTAEKLVMLEQMIGGATAVRTQEEQNLLKLYEAQLEQIEKQQKQFAEIEKYKESLGMVPDIGKGLESALSKFGFGDFAKKLGFDKAQESVEKMAISTGGNTKGLKLAGEYAKVLGKNLFKALSPLAAIVAFVKALGQADKETTELQKSMALTKTEAVGFRMGLTEAANQSGNINVTATKLLKSFGDLNKQFGFITNFATNTLVTMTKLTQVVGVSSESAGNLAAASEITGTSFEDNYKDVLATSYQLQRQSGVQMDLRDILEQTGKVTGTVRANLSANPSQIAKAITQAKLFGASLQDVANAGKSMLDFESSITAELEAELLLGRDINLERARAAALSGDQVTLAQELQKEAGNFSDFTKMNVIQQEALAQAMGMTSDQLADILFQQEVQGKSAKELRALGKEELADRVEAQDLQTKFNATVEKLKAIFVDVATALTPVLSVLGDIFSLVGKIFEFLSPIMGTLTGIATGFAVGGGPWGALIGGTIGAIGDVTKYTSTMDDGIMPAGYGETIIKKGKDTIALNNNDTVVAGTNLMGSTQNAPVQDNTEIKRTNQLLERLLNQPAVFKIGTDEFYTSTSKYSYQIQ
jgi:hypothetical protein